MIGEDRTKQIRVMLVDDHPYFRDLMEVLLNGQSDTKLVSILAMIRRPGST